MDQQAGALDVTQEVMAEARTLGGPGNQPRDIRKDRAISAGATHYPEVGHQGGEGVIGNLGPRRREHRDQGALAGIGQANDSHLGQQLQLELELPLLPIASLGEFLRRAVAIAQVVGIAQSAAATDGHQQTLALLGEIPQEDVGSGIADLRATGDLDHQGGPTGTGGLVGPSTPTIVSGKEALVLEIQQGLKVGVSLQPDIPAPATVTAGGAACGNVFLTAKSGYSIAAASCLQ